jgi:hypothetical protein
MIQQGFPLGWSVDASGPSHRPIRDDGVAVLWESAALPKSLRCDPGLWVPSRSFPMSSTSQPRFPLNTVRRYAYNKLLVGLGPEL